MDYLPGKPSESNHSYIGMMLENMRNMIVPLGGNVEALKDISPQSILQPRLSFLYIKYRSIKVIILL